MGTKKQRKADEAPRPPRRDRHTSHVYEVVRGLDTLKRTAANATTITALADALALWAHAMIDINPAAAARIYRVLCDAWKDNRNELYGADNTNDKRERLTVEFHSLTLEHYGELTGEPRQPLWYQPMIDARAELLRRICTEAEAIAMRASGEPIEPPAITEQDNLIDLQCWRERRPRPIRNLLFAEKGDR